MAKTKEKVDGKKHKEIYAELKCDDSSNCARDFRVVRNQKQNEKKKTKTIELKEAILPTKFWML